MKKIKKMKKWKKFENYFHKFYNFCFELPFDNMIKKLKNFKY